uniref:Ubiquitin family protein n=1 Tax=Colletotrichum fructicola (strain Nara gc5) TaxID=1213859 RepID=L2FL75_COLFN
MASEASSSTAQPAPEAASDHLSVKEKIRQALPLKPTDAQQRLIYRGRPLSQDGDTLLNVIGGSRKLARPC